MDTEIGHGDSLRGRPEVTTKDFSTSHAEFELPSLIPSEAAELYDSETEILSSEEEFDGEILYEDLPEWKDITPVPLISGTVMPIAYSDTFRSVFGYFRAIMAAGELSPRALRLCEHAAKLNAASYGVWMYRRKILAHVKPDLAEELRYISKVIEQNAKNYQVWYHRQKIIELLKDPSREFEFTAKILRRDAKNYHVWQHRQFVLRHFDILDHNEMEFTRGLISDDPFNNSAWMHRFFVLDELPRSCGAKSLLESDVVMNEIQFTLAQISEQIHNESPWNYLRGLLRDQWQPYFELVSKFCEGLYEQSVRSPFLLAFMIEMYEEDILSGYKAAIPAQKLELVAKVHAICKELSEIHDIIRKTYWQWISQRVSVRYAQLVRAAEEHRE